ncbi:hypothetical protein Tco_0715273 [Tanacetum coccineum]
MLFLNFFFNPIILILNLLQSSSSYHLFSYSSSSIMSSSQKSSYNYSRQHQMSIIDTWRHNTLLPPSPPLSPNISPPYSPNIANPPCPTSQPPNQTREKIVNELNQLHHLSNNIETKLQRVANASTQTLSSPPSPSTTIIHPVINDQVTFHFGFCHCYMYTQTLFHKLRDDIHRLESLLTSPSTQGHTPPNNASPTSPLSPLH